MFLKFFCISVSIILTSLISVFNSSSSATCFFSFASIFLSRQCLWRSCFRTNGYLVSLRSEWSTTTLRQSSLNQFWTLRGNLRKHPILERSWNNLVDLNLRTELIISIWDINWSRLPVFKRESMSDTARPTSRFEITRQNTNMNKMTNTMAVPAQVKIVHFLKFIFGLLSYQEIADTLDALIFGPERFHLQYSYWHFDWKGNTVPWIPFLPASWQWLTPSLQESQRRKCFRGTKSWRRTWIPQQARCMRQRTPTFWMWQTCDKNFNLCNKI